MSTTEQTTKRNYANYKVFGFWLAKSFKDQGIIDQTVYDTLIKSQELHGTKEAQDEFYGKFLESIPTITQELKDLTKVEKESNKEAEKAAKIAEKEAAKAAKIAEKEAEKAAKIAEKEAAKETAKAEKLAKRTAAKETAKAVKKMTKDVKKAESTIVADSDDEKTSTRPSTPVLDTEEPQVVVEEVSVVVEEPQVVVEEVSVIEEEPQVVVEEVSVVVEEPQVVVEEVSVVVEEPQVVVEEVSVVEEPQVVVEEVSVVVETAKIIEAETDKLMDGLLQEVLADSAAELSKEEYVEEVGEALYLEVTDPKKKKTMYIRRPVQINNILFADTDLKEQIKGFCVLADAKEVSDPIFQYQRGKKTK